MQEITVIATSCAIISTSNEQNMEEVDVDDGRRVQTPNDLVLP